MISFTEIQERFLLDLARATIRCKLGEDGVTAPDSDDPFYLQPAGCFVSLHSLRDHNLRGCIGRLIASSAMVHAVEEMAQAVLADPRFRTDPILLDELPELAIEITILSALELAEHPLDFDLLDHGIYLRCAGESGCFLPQVARETGWSREQLLARLCTEKMGLAPDAWNHPQAQLHRFTTTHLGPEPF